MTPPAGKPKGKEVVPRQQSLEERLGELDLADHVACAVLLDDIREHESRLAEVKGALTRAILDRAAADGVTSFDLPDRMKVEIRSGTRTVIAGDVLEQGLRAAGMSEERIREIVTETVSYKAKAVEAKKAARMNPDYAAALEAATTVHEAQPSVSIRRR